MASITALVRETAACHQNAAGIPIEAGGGEGVIDIHRRREAKSDTLKAGINRKAEGVVYLSDRRYALAMPAHHQTIRQRREKCIIDGDF